MLQLFRKIVCLKDVRIIMTF